MIYHLLAGDNLSTGQLITITVFPLVLMLLGIGAFIGRRRARALAISDRFGSEYDRAVLKFGSARVSRADHDDRGARAQTPKIRELGVTQREWFSAKWRTVESHFAKHPWTSVTEADDLVNELLQVRGYPLADSDQPDADVPGSFRRMMESYRAAHLIVARRREIAATTDELRIAMTEYRKIFDDLLRAPKTIEIRAAAFGPLQTGSMNAPD